MSPISRKRIKLPFLATLSLALLGASGCASFKLKDPPPGFIEVSSSDWEGDAELRMKAPDNVGLNITSFENRRGGTLPLWANDMVKKLGARGYELDSQTAVKSANGVEGTRFEFSYTPRGADEAQEKFYTAVLFVTDEWKVVVQLAGNAEQQAEHAGDLETILREIKIRGCKVITDVCKAGQPPQLSTGGEPSKKSQPKPNGPGPQEDGSDADAGDKAAASEPASEGKVRPVAA